MDPFKTQSYRFELPSELIASEPLLERDRSRMLVVNRLSKTLEHRLISDLPEFLGPETLVVANNTRVFKARLIGEREGTGGRVEFFLLSPKGPGLWEGLMKAGSRIQPGFRFKVPTLEQGFMAAEVVSRRDDPGGALFTARFEGDPVLETVGEVPLPPYIVEKRRAGGLDSRSAEEELSLYNTVYSKKDGSVAAPTAGRHFTPELIERLKRGGTGWCEITLHVGIGTFKPVSVPEVKDHRMHPETTEISEEASRELEEALRNGRRILAIGTTTARTLEARARVSPDGLAFDPGKREVNLFIHPGLDYEWKAVDAILTNFHLPESTLLMMIASRIGDLGFTLDAYREAVRQGYRFYSYGDAMLVLDR